MTAAAPCSNCDIASRSVLACSSVAVDSISFALDLGRVEVRGGKPPDLVLGGDCCPASVSSPGRGRNSRLGTRTGGVGPPTAPPCARASTCVERRRCALRVGGGKATSLARQTGADRSRSVSDGGSQCGLPPP